MGFSLTIQRFTEVPLALRVPQDDLESNRVDDEYIYVHTTTKIIFIYCIEKMEVSFAYHCFRKGFIVCIYPIA